MLFVWVRRVFNETGRGRGDVGSAQIGAEEAQDVQLARAQIVHESRWGDEGATVAATSAAPGRSRRAPAGRCRPRGPSAPTPRSSVVMSGTLVDEHPDVALGVGERGGLHVIKRWPRLPASPGCGAGPSSATRGSRRRCRHGRARGSGGERAGGRCRSPIAASIDGSSSGVAYARSVRARVMCSYSPRSPRSSSGGAPRPGPPRASRRRPIAREMRARDAASGRTTGKKSVS